MGCDIHAMIQYRPYGERGGYFEFGMIRLPRHYPMFSALAGVRGELTPIVEPRGLPTDGEAKYHADEGELGDHTFSWLLPDEYERALKLTNAQPKTSVGVEYQLVLDILQTLPDARLVFGFDS